MLTALVQDVSSERLVGIELGRLPIRHELLMPGLLHLRTIRVPQRLTQQLQAQLEDRQGMSADSAYIEHFVTVHMTSAPLVSRNVALTKLDLIKF